jgi:hypothetical protein
MSENLRMGHECVQGDLERWEKEARAKERERERERRESRR